MDDDEDMVWWDEDAEAWHTAFPAPAGFIGFESHEPDHPDYYRELSDAEAALMGPRPDRFTAEELAEAAAERDAFFARMAQQGGEAAKALADNASAPAEAPPAPAVVPFPGRAAATAAQPFASSRIQMSAGQRDKETLDADDDVGHGGGSGARRRLRG